MINSRLERLQMALKQISCDAFLVDDPINLFYLTGMNLSQGWLVVYPQGAVLFVDNRYFEMCKNTCPISVMLAEPNHKSLMAFLTEKCDQIKILGFSIEDTLYKNFLDLQKCVNEINIALLPVNNPVKQLRRFKDSEEVNLLRAAATLGAEGFDFVCSILKEGIREIEVADELEIFWKRRGSRGVAFEPIIAFGANTSMPHYRAGRARLKPGDPVLIDIGVNLQHYHSDMTRTLFFGDVPNVITEIHAIVEQAQKAALDLCKPGVSIGALDEAARNVIAVNGYGEYFTHSLGHGIGLEVHEWPILRNAPPYQNILLEPGMAITIEPGIYLPSVGGVRIEDTVVITPHGHENLTKRSTGPLKIT